jgi:type IV secretory pathway VirB3-like protein
LSGIPAMLLGVPWSYLLAGLVGSQSASLNVALLAIAMALNASLIWLIGRFLSRP